MEWECLKVIKINKFEWKSGCYKIIHHRHCQTATVMPAIATVRQPCIQKLIRVCVGLK